MKKLLLVALLFHARDSVAFAASNCRRVCRMDPDCTIVEKSIPDWKIIGDDEIPYQKISKRLRFTCSSAMEGT